MLDIRPATAADRDALAHLLRLFLQRGDADSVEETSLRAFVDRALQVETNITFLIAWDDDIPVGMVSLTFGESTYRFSPFAWCDDLYVQSNHRRRGMGRALMRAAGAHAKAHGCSNLLLGADEQDEAVLAMYRACGFRDLACRLLTLPITSATDS